MANYKNSLGESELFGRMTAGFAKVCESVQSGRFVRNEMGVICESVCEDEDERDSMFGDDDVFIGRNDEYYNEDPDDERVFTPAYWDYSTEGADDECFSKEGPVFKLTDEGKRDFEEWLDADQAGYDLCYGRMKDEKFGKKHLSREQEWEYLTDPKNGLSVEVTGKVEEDDGADAGAGTEGAAPDGETADAGATPDDADVASATPEQINGSVTEGIVGKTLGTIGGATVGSAIGGALGCPVAGGIAGGIAGASLTEGCGGRKKPLKKLIPEGCCGGKAKKVLKEGVQKLCKTCGNPLDETGTCQDCQGYSEVKEGEGEIKLQVPAELKRRADLKANAKANQEKVAQAIRDGKADGIVKEGEAKTLPEGVQLLMGIIDKAFKLERGGSCPGEVPINRIESGLEKKEPFSSGVLVKLNKDGKMSCCGVDDEGEYHLDELIVDDIINEAGKRGLKVKFSPHHLDGFDGTFRIVDDSEFKNRTVEEAENAYVVKKGSIGYYVKDVANDKAVSPSFDTKEEAEQYLKDKFPANEKGSVELTKDDVFGMLVNLLEQIRDGVSVEDVTANPDIEAFDDYSLDEVLELAGKYLEG